MPSSSSAYSGDSHYPDLFPIAIGIGRHVLVIARERLTRSLIGAQLEAEGFEFIGSADIVKAISQLRRRGIEPKVVVIDALRQRFSQEIVDFLFRQGLCCCSSHSHTWSLGLSTRDRVAIRDP